MLHLELVAGVYGTAHAHCPWVEDDNLDEVSGCQLLKRGPVPSPLYFAWLHQSPSINLSDSYCNSFDMAYSNYSSNDTQ